MRHNIAIALAATVFVAAPAMGQNQVRERGQNQVRERGQNQVGESGQNQVRERGQNQVRERGQSRDQFGTKAQKGNKAAVNDALFAAAAAEGGLFELSLSQLGAQRATDPELKRFSEKMIEEHTRMNAELKDLASRKGMALPTQVGYCAQFCAQSLAGLSGEDFDHCYAKAQFIKHMDAVGLFEAEAERGSDRDVSALAAKALPQIKEHLRMIKPIAKKYMMEDDSEGARENTGRRNENRGGRNENPAGRNENPGGRNLRRPQ